MRRPILPAILALSCGSLWLSMPPTSAAGASPPSPEDALLSSATRVFLRAVDTPSAAIPAAVLQRARAIAVIPTARNDGPFNAGTGVVSARERDAQQWSAPAVINYDGRIVPTLDVDTIDLIFVAVTSRGLRYLSEEEVSLGEPNAIPPGPLGQDAQIDINVDILAYMQFGDFFAGVTVEQWAICAAPYANERLYGKPLNTRAVFRGGFRAPTLAQAWRDVLAGFYKETS